MSLDTLLQQINASPEDVGFDDVISVIDESYDYTPVRFINGGTINEAGENTGSCKIFAFASMHDLDEQQTLHCFGDYYRVDVLGSPAGDDHQNIRNFIEHGWAGISFEADALTARSI